MQMIRIDIDNKEKRVAVFLINYNMIERVDRIVEHLIKYTKHPTDIYVIDNGTDLVKKSKYSSIVLAKNIQTTNGWLMGMDYADKIALTEKFTYYAYCFVITSVELIDPQDIISIMVNKIDEDTVGIHPSLTIDSNVQWKYMNNNGTNNLDTVKMIDNIFALYKSDWFDSIGRFNKDLTYAWGIDIETGYIARKMDKQICIDHSIQIKKETNIGYTMNRMNMSQSERQNKAFKEMALYFISKYGIEYNKVLFD